MNSSSGIQAAELGYEIVSDLLKRQDEVLVELDALNLRVEKFIANLSEARQEQSLKLDSDSSANVAELEPESRGEYIRSRRRQRAA